MNSFKKQSVLNLIIVYFGLFAGFISTFVRAKVLLPEEIGLLALLGTVAGIFQYFVIWGFPAIILKFYPEVRNNSSKEFGFILFVIIVPLILYFIATIVFIFIREYLINVYKNNLLFSKYVNYILVLLFLSVFLNLFDVIFRAQFKSVFPNFISNVLLKLFNLGVLIIVYYYSLRFKTYFHLYILGMIVVLISYIFFFSKTFTIQKPDFSFLTRKKVGEYFIYGTTMLISGMAGRLTNQVDKIMLGKFTTLKDLGIYSIAAAFGMIISLVGSSLTRTAHPKISDSLSKKDLKSVGAVYKSTLNFQLYFTSFLFVVIVLTSKELLSFLGPVYSTGVLVVFFISLGEFINNGTGMCGGIIAYSRYYRMDIYLRVFLLVINVILNYFLIKVYGITGAALATSISLILYNLFKVIFVYVKFNLLPYTVENLKIIGANILILLIFYFTKKMVHIEFNNLKKLFLLGIFIIIIFIVYNIILKYLFKFKKGYFFELIRAINIRFQKSRG